MAKVQILTKCRNEAFTKGNRYSCYPVLHVCKAKRLQKFRIRTPDSDIFFICLYYAKTELQGLNVFIDTGNGNNIRFFDVTGYASGLSIERCSALLGLYAFTWCDTISCFKGIGKVKPIKALDKNDHFELPLSQIGSSFSVSANLKLDLEEFVCLLYSRKHHKETSELRLSILQEKCDGDKTEIKWRFSFRTLSSCRDVLKQHKQRANYQV